MKQQIRIIKHAGRDVEQDKKEVAGIQINVSTPEKVSSGETVRIVTAWINELRQKKMTDLAVAHALKASLTKTA